MDVELALSNLESDNMNPYKEAWMVHAGMIHPRKRQVSVARGKQHNIVKEYVIPTILMKIPYVSTAYTIYSVVDWILD